MKRLRWILMILSVLPALAAAGVNLKNGNFYISYTDILLGHAPTPLEITRTYNSKATEVGWFGFGWGSDYETRPLVAPEGAVAIRENGSGATTWYKPEEPGDVAAAVERLVSAIQAAGALEEGEDADALRRKLASDADLRLRRAQRYGVAADIPVGTRLASLSDGGEVRRTREGFVRSKAPDGPTQHFSAEGRLLKIVTREGRTTEISYHNGHVSSVEDGYGQRIDFRTNAEGRVVRLWSGEDRVAEYTYDGPNLVESTDVDGNRYGFAYDDHHNLTVVRYGQGSEMRVSYDDQTSMVTRVFERDGTDTRYRYGSDPENPDLHYWTEVTRGDGESASTSRYEYEVRVRPDGTNYTYRVVVDRNGVRDETVYSECCGRPLQITRGDRVTRFEYDETGRLVYRKGHEGDELRMAYDPSSGKVSRVEKGETWSAFHYDARGNLQVAEDHRGRRLELDYDQDNRIARIVEPATSHAPGAMLRFKYDQRNKPVEIAVDGMGAITVAYDADGEIRQVDSQGGPEIALKVTQVFQGLMTLVKPAGVSLGF